MIRFDRVSAAGSIWVTPRMSPWAASWSCAPHDGHVVASVGTVAEHHGQGIVSPLLLDPAPFPAAGLMFDYSHSIVAGGLDEMS